MKNLLAFVVCLLSASAFADRPNIVLIMCDDLGYSDVGFNGSTDIRTPALDRLAERGTVCTSGYVPHPFCGPSRMGLMTGRYPHEFGAPYNLPGSEAGIEEYDRKGVDVNETLISTVLQKAGYFTGAIGKWHMGIDPQYHPNSRGFDDFYGFLGGGHKYFPSEYRPLYEQQVKNGTKHIWDYLAPLEHNGAEVNETEYITDALSREAVRFIGDAVHKDRPFFLYVAYNAPHTPLEAKEEDLAEFEDIEDDKRRTYAAMVHAVDRGVGDIVRALAESNQFNNTLIVFLSDNGGRLDEGATNVPLREGKGSTYEGGYRVPMFAHWPQQVPAGKRFDYPITALDFYPTFAALAEAKIPAGKHLDGLDIWNDLVTGQVPRREQMIYAIRHGEGVSNVGARRGKWKIVRPGKQDWRLFDIEQDKGEENDLSERHPDLLRSMVREVQQWSQTHTRPEWFHARDARDNWQETGMPNYDETFGVE